MVHWSSMRAVSLAAVPRWTAMMGLLGIAGLCTPGCGDDSSPTAPSPPKVPPRVVSESCDTCPTLITGLTITGTVTDESGKGIEGKVVLALERGGSILADDLSGLPSIARDKTDENGRYMLKFPDEGGAPFNPYTKYGERSVVDIEPGGGHNGEQLDLAKALSERGIKPKNGGDIKGNETVEWNVELEVLRFNVELRGTTQYTNPSGSLRAGDAGIEVRIVNEYGRLQGSGAGRYVGMNTHTDSQGKWALTLNDVGSEPFEIYLEAVRDGYYASSHYAVRGEADRSPQQPNPAFSRRRRPAVLPVNRPGHLVGVRQGSGSDTVADARGIREQSPRTTSIEAPPLTLVHNIPATLQWSGQLGHVGNCNQSKVVGVRQYVRDEYWDDAPFFKVAGGSESSEFRLSDDSINYTPSGSGLMGTIAVRDSLTGGVSEAVAVLCDCGG